MNQENQQNLQEPNLERITPLWWGAKTAWDSMKSSGNKLLENPQLIALLTEYQLEEFNADFEFLSMIAMRFKEAYKISDAEEEILSTLFRGFKQMYDSLRFINDSGGNVEIVIKSTITNDKIIINDRGLITAIQEKIREKYQSFENLTKNDLKIEKVIEWAEFEKVFWQGYSKRKSKKGRKEKYQSIMKLIDTLQKYLQAYTEIKAEEGTFISRSQSRFIFNFLKIYGLIEDIEHISYEEDNIRQILKRYRNSRDIN